RSFLPGVLHPRSSDCPACAIIKGVMLERLFIGRQKPILPQTVRVLQQRYAQDGMWDMSGVLTVLPGRQAARRLIRLIETAATREGFTRVQLPETITPSELPERLYSPTLPLATPTQA